MGRKGQVENRPSPLKEEAPKPPNRPLPLSAGQLALSPLGPSGREGLAQGVDPGPGLWEAPTQLTTKGQLQLQAPPADGSSICCVRVGFHVENDDFPAQFQSSPSQELCEQNAVGGFSTRCLTDFLQRAEATYTQKNICRKCRCNWGPLFVLGKPGGAALLPPCRDPRLGAWGPAGGNFRGTWLVETVNCDN